MLKNMKSLQLEKEEILAPHTHFCLICGKGFKRDANLRMHMRGHGDEYKTPAALAKPHKEMCSEAPLVKRYSCPYSGCKRNKDHIKFQPLKMILCVKNHYKRTHCDKTYTCRLQSHPHPGIPQNFLSSVLKIILHLQQDQFQQVDQRIRHYRVPFQKI